MEGFLKRWTGIVTRWKKQYFILHDGILLYCNEKGGPTQGSIHLKISSLILTPDDPLRIIINSGTKEVHLRASSIEEKMNWVNALRLSQSQTINDRSSVYDDVDRIANTGSDISEEVKSYFSHSNLKSLNEELAQLWSTQAMFEEALSNFNIKIDKHDKNYEYYENLKKHGSQIKVNKRVFNITFFALFLFFS